jgi:hypothetical protein
MQLLANRRMEGIALVAWVLLLAGCGPAVTPAPVELEATDAGYLVIGTVTDGG